MSIIEFNYDEAFVRNIGWVTASEQQQLKNKKVALAGMGGVGGSHLLILTRLGIGNFNIADMDIFELKNFNRQAGATMETIGKNKAEVLAKMAKDINPLLNLNCYSEGLTDANIENFLQGSDLFIDGLDYFAFDMRDKVYKLCAKLSIPVIVAAPIGMGCAYLIYQPGHMTLTKYFDWEGLSEENKAYYFMLGLSPTLSLMRYIVDYSNVNIKNKTGPSTPMACILSSGIMCTEALKILLKRGKVYPLPYYQLFDPYLEKFVRGYLFFGNKNPLQKLKFLFIKTKA